MRRELSRLVRMLREIEGIRDLGMTTNGILLADQAAGILRRRLAPSQHQSRHLDPARFSPARRRDGLDKLSRAFWAAKRAGFQPIKVNAISMRGITESEVVPLAASRACMAWKCVSSNTCDWCRPLGARQGLFCHEIWSNWRPKWPARSGRRL